MYIYICIYQAIVFCVKVQDASPVGAHYLARISVFVRPLPGDGHLAGFCVVTWLFHFPILKVLAWTNATSAKATQRCEQCYGSHGNQATVAKTRLGKMSWRPWQKGHEAPERNPFRATRCFIRRIHHDSS